MLRFGRRPKGQKDQEDQKDQNGQERGPRFLAADDPLALAVNRAWNTGEPVLWSAGEALPDPSGPNRPVER